MGWAEMPSPPFLLMKRNILLGKRNILLGKPNRRISIACFKNKRLKKKSQSFIRPGFFVSW